MEFASKARSNKVHIKDSLFSPIILISSLIAGDSFRLTNLMYLLVITIGSPTRHDLSVFNDLKYIADELTSCE